MYDDNFFIKTECGPGLGLGGTAAGEVEESGAHGGGSQQPRGGDGGSA